MSHASSSTSLARWRSLYSAHRAGAIAASIRSATPHESLAMSTSIFAVIFLS